jgi:SAM-dependent methyltransferase
MTGGGPNTFAVISDGHVAQLRRYIDLQPDQTILEIGCGIGRDAIPLAKILSSSGRYVGVDIIGRSIDWCSRNITPRHPNFTFLHYDVRDQLHNPQGTTATLDIRLPLAPQSVDLIILWSVFTHMFRPDIVHYLREFRRVLKPDGLVWASCFVFDDAVLESARRTNLTPYDLRFEYVYEPGCRINSRKYPTGAVAYTEEAVGAILLEGGMRLARPIIHGSWSGLHADADGGQEVLILKIGPPPVPMQRSPPRRGRLGAVVGRVARRILRRLR